jgi:amino acid adenylation domain-containing protein
MADEADQNHVTAVTPDEDYSRGGAPSAQLRQPIASPALSQKQADLIECFSGRRVDYPTCHGVHEYIERQVDRMPDAVAVDHGTASLTYAELEVRANQLAHCLRGHGVGPNVFVGILIERCFDMFVAVLAVLKAGGAWVPLDPEHPSARLAQVVEDTGTPLILTHERFAALLPGVVRDNARILCLDTDDAQVAGFRDERLVCLNEPGDAAFMIYTSGSTGEPKGCPNTHRGISNYLQWMATTLGLEPGDRHLQKTAFTFDASAIDLLWPLVCGATAVIAAPGGHRDAAYLRTTIREQHITDTFFVPSMLHAFLDEVGMDDCTSVKRIVCGGEVLRTDLVRRFHVCMPHARLINIYGPTECAVACTWWECVPGHDETPVPIGRPIPNTRIYLLDEDGRPVPPGAAGEIHLGGAHVGRGYWKRQELTVERFVADPFSSDPGARMFRTGDRGRFRPDGAIEFLGRVDFQLKLRGQRIEPGEIEAVLANHESVGQAVVVAQHPPRRRGAAVLTAYVVGRKGATAPSAETLRDHLSARLPDYMVPARFVRLDALPLSAHGKADRIALAQREEEPLPPSRPPVAPRNLNEMRMLSLWQKVLAIDGIGVRDDFFDLGGDSLVAIRLVREVRHMFGVELPLASLLGVNTIEGMVSLVNGDPQYRYAPLVPIRAKGRYRPFFCVHGIGGNVLRFWDLARAMGEEFPFYGLQAKGFPPDRERAHATVELAARDYAAALLQVPRDGPIVLGGFSSGGIIAFEMARQLMAAGHAVSAVVMFDTPMFAKNVADRLPPPTARDDLLMGLKFLDPGLVDAATEALSLEELALSFREARQAKGLSPHPLGFNLDEQVHWQLFKQDHAAALHGYVVPDVDVPIVYIKATKEPPIDPAYWWSHRSPDVSVHEVDCSHLEIVEKPYVDTVAAHVRALVTDSIATVRTSA